jgi:predicted AAA+ superfamily ATPase
MGMDKKNLRFILSGSSARKLKRGAANLLGGRALDLRLHPFTSTELGGKFNIDYAIERGTLPKIYLTLLEEGEEKANSWLRSYITTYVKEEVQAEALTRNIGAFLRFLTIASHGNGQVIEFSNISRECSVPASTVKEYYQILEDTLLGNFLWPHDRSERKKARPKFYFFDTGVVRALQNRLTDPPTPAEYGVLFETWLLNELMRHRDYMGKELSFSLWRRRDHEIDILISDGHGPRLAVECKTGRERLKKSTVDAFHRMFPEVPVVTVTAKGRRGISEGIEIIPWKEFITSFQEGKPAAKK